MYILGLNGWFDRGHDAAACLIKDGRLLCMVEEERLTRRKHAYDQLPHHSSLYCLGYEDITLDDIDCVAMGWNYQKAYSFSGRSWNYSDKEVVQLLFPRELFNYKKYPKIFHIPHHLAHASSTFRVSPFREASVIILDGQGESTSITLAHGLNNSIKIIKEFPISSSLGYFFEAFCKYLGFRSYDGGKLMGLASYGYAQEGNFFKLSEHEVIPNFSDKAPEIFTDDPQKVITSYWLEKLTDLYGPPKRSVRTFNPLTLRLQETVPVSQREKNLAATAQKVLQDAVFHLVSMSVKLTGCRNVCLSGGVALNCSTNGKLLEQGLVDNLFVMPATGDSGVALGAALEAQAASGRELRLEMKHAYWGPEFNDEIVKQTLEELNLTLQKVGDPAAIAANRLEQGKVVGWFQGRSEIGPRALGHRSILGNPKIPEMLERINTIKGREVWRPLAPAVTEEAYQDYFALNSPSPFMLFSCPVKKHRQAEIPAVVHVDGSARPQVVTKEVEPLFWKLIHLFGERTSTPVVLNTSFNTAREPIVCTPADAIKTYFSTGLDVLFMGTYLLEKQ